MSKKTVAVLFGSISSEHEVSLLSATSVINHIPRDKYDVLMIGITKDGRWLYYTGDVSLIKDGSWETSGCTSPAILSPDRGTKGIAQVTQAGICHIPVDVVFPVLHGEHGEDGTIQGLFEMAGIPYVGCHVLSSAACMDKEVTHILLENAGIPMAPYAVFCLGDLKRFEEIEKHLAQKLGYPMFVKPANTGSSVGVSKAKDKADLLKAVKLGLQYDRKLIVESTIVGDEVECAVLGNEQPIASSVLGEIVPHHEFYDYEGKYLDDSTDLYIPARIPEETTQKIRETAVKAFQVMGCGGLARIDFFACKDGKIILNELNTIPGFTSISMYPKLFEASGISYPDLIDRLITLALHYPED
ncbi:D-alanine--D-alanine ligase family protein [Youxingia wuxianensis]|uniref:D-alanine--D-alanine ligase n=1 Tax=Youxingia wuxianensis TaxID=2763678 RepID=A0A926IHX7_9FIRM|nr:D-alanine--D-alanine ligase family protein [Youxingia wuxianensis]MBC8585766.1 D-alanine--D-alanine ligase [Youxingia wuxianensis]